MIRKKYRVIETVTTVEGTLYQGELVTFENKEVEGHWRVKDSMGRIWILDKKVLSKSPTQLSRS
tara:strand:- start:343 stop:534 length:192 start_codon:yes stop_codon:yes gene_type:complete